MKCICGYEAVDSRDLSFHIIKGQRAGGQHGRDNGQVKQAQVVVEQPKQTELRQTKPANKGPGVDRKWIIIGLAAVGWLASLGLGKLVFGIEQQSYTTTGPLGLVVLALFFGCPFIIWRATRNSGGRRKTKVVNPIITPDGQSVALAVPGEAQSKERGVSHVAPDIEGDINAFRIHVRHGNQELGENPVVPVLSYFCHVPDNELLGQPRQLRNDKKWYHVLVAGPEPNMLRPLVVGDASFMEPRVMSRYLDAPCQRSYIEFVRENMQKWIGPGLLALMDGILLLVIYLRISAPPPVP